MISYFGTKWKWNGIKMESPVTEGHFNLYAAKGVLGAPFCSQVSPKSVIFDPEFVLHVKEKRKMFTFNVYMLNDAWSKITA